MTIISEKELIEQSQKGDSEAFNKLVNLYEPRIRKLSQKVCSGLPSEADDVLQDAFLNALKNIKKFKAQSDFGTWLYRIASNLCWKKFRDKKRKPTISLSMRTSQDDEEDYKEEHLIDPSHTPDSKAEREELKGMIGQVLENLPDEYRNVLLMSDLNEWPNSKIAKELHISLSAVKSRLHRARAILKNAFLHYHK